MNTERFHNALAMALGYESIVNEKRYDIIVEDNSGEPKIIIKNSDGYELLSFCPAEAEELKRNYCDIDSNIDKDVIIMIIDAVHQAYIEATANPF